MIRLRSEFLSTLEARGFLHQATDLEELDALAASEKLTAYIGFDATADSLHVGSLLPIMCLRWLQKCGHKPIVLMGGGTTKIGDPSGKDEARKLLTDEVIATNIAAIKRNFDPFLTFGEGANDALMVNNADWLDGLAYIQLLRDVGPHFTVNRMLSFDSVRLRLDREQPLTFLEFNYMILQAYDFLELNRRLDCRLQMGGSDQWGNIVNGMELTRRISGRSVFGLTTPLITTASGLKMGKTHAGAVWLSPDRLSDYDYWQFWRNCEDGDVGRFLRLFTELPLDEIAKLEALEGAELNAAKKILADTATGLCRGEAAARQAAETAKRTFEGDGLGEDLPQLRLPRARLAEGVALFQLLREAGLVASSGEGRRLIKGGGARVNDQAAQDETAQVKLDDLTGEGVIKLSAGKKRHALVRLSED
ncbi:MAG: tyrosine--tRNA ligase [Rhodospirillales bacterium]